MAEIKDLIGKSIIKIEGGKKGDEFIKFFTKDVNFIMHHYQNCCENVLVDDICGDFDDLLNTPVIEAFVKTNVGENPEGVPAPKWQDCWTWTFYTIKTSKGTVTIRWYGESNGYYSEEVNFDSF